MAAPNKKLIIGVVCLVTIGVAGYYFWPKKAVAPIVSPSPVASETPVLLHAFSDRAETFSVSGPADTFPVFYKDLIIDPFRVKEGEQQYFSVWLTDLVGIEKVTGSIETNSGPVPVSFALVEGTAKDGRWLATWKVTGFNREDAYSHEIVAVNEEGKDSKITCFWYLIK